MEAYFLMYRDIAQIKQFYHSALGHLTVTTLRRTMARHWPHFFDTPHVCAGVGYALPYLQTDHNHVAVMAASMGVGRWPQHAPNRTVLTLDHVLPFADASLDRILLVHGLENAAYLHELMQDCWRVLKPNGRLLMIVPNRRGLWARNDKTPFGHGRPYSMKQIRSLLYDTDFVAESHVRALYFLPFHSRVLGLLAPLLEWLGARLLPKMGGVLIAEASKRLYNVTPLPVSVSRWAQPAFVLQPQ